MSNEKVTKISQITITKRKILRIRLFNYLLLFSSIYGYLFVINIKDILEHEFKSQCQGHGVLLKPRFPKAMRFVP